MVHRYQCGSEPKQCNNSNNSSSTGSSNTNTNRSTSASTRRKQMKMGATHVTTHAFLAAFCGIMSLCYSDAYLTPSVSVSSVSSVSTAASTTSQNRSLCLSTLQRHTTTQMQMARHDSDLDGGIEGIILKSSFMKDRASLLESAFDSMDDRDKYDAVLTGLCSKILDGKSTTTSTSDDDVVDNIASDATLTPSQLAMKTMIDPIRLLGEMNRSKVKASSRSLMALIDVSFVFVFLSFLFLLLN
jgi:hypothetical protein